MRTELTWEEKNPIDYNIPPSKVFDTLKLRDRSPKCQFCGRRATNENYCDSCKTVKASCLCCIQMGEFECMTCKGWQRPYLEYIV